MTAINRRAFVKRLVEAAPNALFVAGLGNPVYDLAAAGDGPQNIYLWGAMGGAAPMALGLALAQPERRIIVLTGDGEILMALGAFATIAAKRPTNLALCILDNEAFAETGEQSGLTSQGVDLAGVARAAGFAAVDTITMQERTEAATSMLSTAAGPVCVVVKLPLGAPDKVLPIRDGFLQTARFRAHLGFPPEG